MLVTERMTPLTVDGRVIHQIGLPYHWGPNGYSRRRRGQRADLGVVDPNVHIQEVKALTRRHPARPPAARAGPARRTSRSTATGPASPSRPDGRSGHELPTRRTGARPGRRGRVGQRATAAHRASSPTPASASAARRARSPARSGTRSPRTASTSPACPTTTPGRSAPTPGGTSPSSSSASRSATRRPASSGPARRCRRPGHAGSGRRCRAPGGDVVRRTTGPDFRWLMSSDVCKHCTHAACLDVCPTGALIRTEFGTVVVQEDVCNGCGYCVPACPYGVIDQRPADGRRLQVHALLRPARASAWSRPAPRPARPSPSSSASSTSCGSGPRRGSSSCTRPESAEARLYGHDPADGVGGDGAFFLLLDEPRSTACRRTRSSPPATCPGCGARRRSPRSAWPRASRPASPGGGREPRSPATGVQSTSDPAGTRPAGRPAAAPRAATR